MERDKVNASVSLGGPSHLARPWETQAEREGMGMSKQPSGAVLYRGPSLQDGAPIVAVVVFKSTNDKTGNMAQVYILREDMHPMDAIKQDLDKAICGTCPLRYTYNPVTGKWGRVCYVNLGFGPSSIYKAMKRGLYPDMTPEEVGAILRGLGRGVRLGAYGDPGMIDVSVWERLVNAAGTFHTAYTHQWREPFFQASLLHLAMASIDDVNTVTMLKELYPDARWYRLAKDMDDVQAGEIACPSKKDAQGVRRVTCKDCKLCAGTSRNAKNITIVENE